MRIDLTIHSTILPTNAIFGLYSHSRCWRPGREKTIPIQLGPVERTEGSLKRLAPSFSLFNYHHLAVTPRNIFYYKRDFTSCQFQIHENTLRMLNYITSSILIEIIAINSCNFSFPSLAISLAPH